MKEVGITTYPPLLQVSNVRAKHLAPISVKSSGASSKAEKEYTHSTKYFSTVFDFFFFKLFSFSEFCYVSVVKIFIFFPMLLNGLICVGFHIVISFYNNVVRTLSMRSTL